MVSMTNSKVTFESFTVYADGSGIEAVANAYGFRFAVSVGSSESIKVFPLFSQEYTSTGRTKAIRKSAAAMVERVVAGRVGELGDDWANLNRLMYH